jgi:hypothetical protein
MASDQETEAKRDTIYELGLALISFRHVFLPRGNCALTFSFKVVFFFIQTVQRREFVLFTPLLSKSNSAGLAGRILVLLEIGHSRRKSVRSVIGVQLRSLPVAVLRWQAWSY